METIIAAAAGYSALYWTEGVSDYTSEPIIAWFVQKASGGEFSSVPIGIDGTLETANAILCPDGRVNWMEQQFDSVEDCMDAIRNR
jgi:hypothetical protein